MPTSYNVQDAKTDQLALVCVFHLVRDEGINVENGRSWKALRVLVSIFAGAVLVFTASGCIATRSWVQDQLNPITAQLGQQQSRLSETDAKADRALTGLQNLHLEHRLVLDTRHGPTFAFGSAALTENDKRKINGFFEDLEG